MIQIIKLISNKKLDEAKNLIIIKLSEIVENKLFEKKKQVAAKCSCGMKEERIDELKTSTLSSYVGKASKDVANISHDRGGALMRQILIPRKGKYWKGERGDYKNSRAYEDEKLIDKSKKITKRLIGIKRATNKIVGRT